MRPLPTIATPVEGETLHGYGCRVLAFVLATGCTATLSDRDLELADHVYPIAISGREMLPIAVDRLTAARHLVLAAIATRRRLDAEKAPADVQAAIAPAPATGLGGSRVLLHPRPYSRPPAGVAIDIPF